jgi:hypothetical protein
MKNQILIVQEDEEFLCKHCDKKRTHSTRTAQESHSDMDTE